MSFNSRRIGNDGHLLVRQGLERPRHHDPDGDHGHVTACLHDARLSEGDEVLALLRARRADVPIVVTSGHDLDALPADVRVLAKPFGIEELEGLLNGST